MAITGRSYSVESWHQLFLLLAFFEILFGFYLILVQYGTYVGVRYVAKRQSESSLYYYTQSRLIWVLPAICSPLLIAHLLLRFRLVSVLAQRPILFFRSFRSNTASTVFAQIVAKAARRVGVVEGLVHTSQPSSALHAGLDVAEQAHFAITSADKWQEWVLDRLGHASAVIVDIAEPSESLTWEVTNALEKVGAKRVALLIARGSAPHYSGGVLRCEYTLNRGDMKKARRVLRTWLRSAVANRVVGHDRGAQ